MPMDEHELQTVFSKGAERHKQFASPIPSGERYTFLLKEVSLGKSKKNNAPQITETYRVVAGQWEGKEHRIFTQLNNEVSWSICLGRWMKFGYDATSVSSLKEVEEYCSAIQGGEHLCVGLITDQEGSDTYKNLKIESVSRSKSEDKEKNSEPKKTDPSHEEKTSTKKETSKPAVSSDDAADEDDVPAASDEDEGSDLAVGDTCEYTFKGAKQKGLVKELLPATKDQPEDKVVFLTDGKPFKVKASNITSIVSKGPK